MRAFAKAFSDEPASTSSENATKQKASADPIPLDRKALWTGLDADA